MHLFSLFLSLVFLLSVSTAVFASKRGWQSCKSGRKHRKLFSRYSNFSISLDVDDSEDLSDHLAMTIVRQVEPDSADFKVSVEMSKSRAVDESYETKSVGIKVRRVFDDSVKVNEDESKSSKSTTPSTKPASKHLRIVKKDKKKMRLVVSEEDDALQKLQVVEFSDRFYSLRILKKTEDFFGMLKDVITQQQDRRLLNLFADHKPMSDVEARFRNYLLDPDIKFVSPLLKGIYLPSAVQVVDLSAFDSKSTRPVDYPDMLPGDFIAPEAEWLLAFGFYSKHSQKLVQNVHLAGEDGIRMLSLKSFHSYIFEERPEVKCICYVFAIVKPSHYSLNQCIYQEIPPYIPLAVIVASAKSFTVQAFDLTSRSFVFLEKYRLPDLQRDKAMTRISSVLPLEPLDLCPSRTSLVAPEVSFRASFRSFHSRRTSFAEMISRKDVKMEALKRAIRKLIVDIQALHKAEITHGSISSKSILVDPDYNATLCNFQNSRLLDQLEEKDRERAFLADYKGFASVLWAILKEKPVLDMNIVHEVQIFGLAKRLDALQSLKDLSWINSHSLVRH